MSKTILSTIKSHTHIGLFNNPHYRPTKFPIILCHGLFGYNKLGPSSLPRLQVHYWRGILEALKDLGCDVYAPKVGTTSSLKTRANELKLFLDHLSKERGYTQFNLVAHSMGGLDSRYMISHLPSSQYNIASLTTIATPHRGSSFMDFLRENTGLGSKIVECQVLQSVKSTPTSDNSSSSTPGTTTTTSGNTHPLIKAVFSTIDAPAFYNLTSSYCSAFNLASTNSTNTAYYSYAAVTSVPKYAPLYLSHQIILKKEGVNDGLVSLSSAKWGEFRGVLDCDHWDILPPKFARITPVMLGKKKFDSIGFYLSMATQLAQNGF